MKRLAELGAHPLTAVAVSAVLHVALHLRTGWTGVPFNAGLGLVLAMSYNMTQSIWPGVIGRLCGVGLISLGGLSLI